jgi:hypothetical protein
MIQTKTETNSDWFYGSGNNGANREWRAVLAKYRKGK